MSLNLGNDAIAASQRLHQAGGDVSSAFQDIRDGLLEQSRRCMNLALDGPADERHALVGYARALRDVVRSLEAAAIGKNPNQVQQHGPEVKRAPAR